MSNIKKTIISFLTITLFFFAGAFVFPYSASAAIKARTASSTNLIGYWSFNEGTSTTAGDYSGRGNKGTLTGAGGLPTWTSGKLGKALSFDGVDDYVSVPNGATRYTFDDADGGTISFWLYLRSYTDGHILSTASSATAGWGIYTRSGPTIELRQNRATAPQRVQIVTASAPTLNRWTHVTMAYIAGDANPHYYINGILVDHQNNDSGSGAIGVPTGVMSIGAYTDGTVPANAIIDEVKFHNRVLTASEVLALYKSGVGVQKIATKNGLVGQWKFDEGTSTTAGDSSGNGNKGTLTSGPTWTSGKLGKALSFDGVDDNVNTGNLSGSVSLDGPATISGWYYFTTSALARGDSINLHTQLYQHPANNFLYIGGGGADYFNVASVLTLNAWHHIVLTYNGTHENDLLYINGVRYTVNIQTAGTSHASLSTFRIGATSASVPGKVDDVRVYNRVLTQAEVLSIYKENATPVNTSQNNKLTSGLVGYWSFNGSDVDNTYIYDRSGQANHGYLHNIATSTAKTMGKVGQGLKLDGTSNMDFNQVIYTGNTNWSASVWIRTRATDNWIITNQSGGPVTNAMRIIAGKINYYNYDGIWNSTSGTITVNDGKWHLLTWVNSSNMTMDMYVDGVLDANDIYSTTNASGPLNRIGRQYGAGASSAIDALDEVRIYSRGLSAAEVKQLYLLGR